MERIRNSVSLFVFLWLGFFSCAAQTALLEAQTITTDTTWPNIGEPYEITGNITVAPAATLHIEPGVELKFGPGVALSINGTLSTQGDSQNPIRINRLDPAQAWSGIYLYDGAAGTVIRHARISGASGPCIYIAGGVHEISSNIIHGCGYGIQIQSGSPRIENNLIVENSSYGVYATGSAMPILRNNTIDRNGGYGLYLSSALDVDAIVENNIITRNETGWYRGENATRGFNNVWRNGTDYSAVTAAATDLSSDPQYLDPYSGDWRLAEGSPSKSASDAGGEIGAYGNGGDVLLFDIDYSTTPTTSGALTQHERWSGEVVLTGSVTVGWPWRLVIDPGTVVRMPENATLTINSIASIVGTLEAPIQIDVAPGGTETWSGIYIYSGA
ncbi:MAG: right-handed parallel beta-helix repeat-containing protein, partial [Gammaproteobacteria bacterium]|nr:right-handed parallel beta-helix repeat-containing protein [Gammaproteobacteria bacterium]